MCSTSRMATQLIRVDPRVVERAHEARRREWEVLARDLCADRPADDRFFPEIAADELLLHAEEDAFILRASGSTEEHRIDRQRLSPQLKEYLAVIEMLDDDYLPMQRAEVLDMAKRVVHDAAANLLSELLPSLNADHEHRRRLFSLLVALSADTTKKRMAHRHL